LDEKGLMGIKEKGVEEGRFANIFQNIILIQNNFKVCNSIVLVLFKIRKERGGFIIKPYEIKIVLNKIFFVFDKSMQGDRCMMSQ
jgi:hypothetical protein